MPYRLGYACQNMALKNQKVRANRRAIKRTFEEKGLEYIGELVAQNLKDLHTILEWNHKHDIRVFRLSSDLTPWGSEYEFTDLPNATEVMALFKKAGQYALDHDIRLSFHPGQFCVLASPKEQVVQNAAIELNKHAEIMDLMQLPRIRTATTMKPLVCSKRLAHQLMALVVLG